MTDRLGIWIVGALGGVGTTVVVGARAIARGLVSKAGLATARAEFSGMGLTSFDDMVFGGHDVRSTGLWENAYQISKLSGSLDFELIQELHGELDEISKRIRPGTAINCGPAIEGLVTHEGARSQGSLRDAVTQIRADLTEFKRDHGLTRVVMVNLASTEPDVADGSELQTAQDVETVLDADRASAVRPSLLYAYAAFQEGCAYINFTPSTAALCGGMRALAEDVGLPYMGNDGKTGETLVKSALAPMFKGRELKVLSWQGYNILGDRDGEILAHDDNAASKLRSKDAVLQGILGYPLHTHVGIDFVESLDDRKTAWDFIHFQGFLDHRMSMQFTWHGCDAILAAPLVLDMARLTGRSLRRGEGGVMPHLACFFKSPLSVQEHDLHRQFQALRAYAAASSSAED